ncbi:hypothetical protein LJC63_02975 [Ruminococcaceae bacterium OttesenSCG-928-L11]|nr:hypothetical protein [Ruminococcaceae bacterium OttesenSCG-928-L11]
MQEPQKYTKAEQTLAAWNGSGRFPHAILIEGQNNGANTAFSARIAKAVLCEAEGDVIPCEGCRHCVKMDKEIHPDYLTFEGEGRSRSFHIETVRDIRTRAYLFPNEALKKVFLLKNVQDMSVQAQNALLKILEEPPETVVFILTCENKSALLETILSRVTLLSLEGVEAISDEREVEAGQIWEALLSGRELDALAAFSAYERDRQGFIELLGAIRSLLEARLLSDTANPSLSVRETLAPLRLMQIVDIIDEMAVSAAGNGSVSLLGSLLCARVETVIRKSR